jgi:hypothetical protein
MVQSSATKLAAASSPKKPARLICEDFGSTFAIAASDTGPSSAFGASGRNKLTAVLDTISSSKPSSWVILVSIHCLSTAWCTFETSTGLLKLAGNFVAFRALLSARESETDAVPLIDGMLFVVPS